MASGQSLVLKHGEPRLLQYAEKLRQDYLLLEVTEDLLQEIHETGVCIKGEPDEDAMLCTSSSTYAIKVVGTTNTVLLGRDAQLEQCQGTLGPGSQPTQGVASTPLGRITGLATQREQVLAAAGNAAFVVTASSASHLELQLAAPRLARLRALLEETMYHGEEEEEEADAAAGSGDASPGRPRRYTFDDLLATVQASKGQLRSALERWDACELSGYWRLVDAELLGTVLEVTLLTAVERGWDLCDLPMQQIVAAVAEQGFDERLVRHCLRVHSAQRGTALEGVERADLTGSATCRHFGTKLLASRRGQDWEVAEFMRAWCADLPEGLTPCLAMLQGQYLSSPCGSSIKYFPVTSLPSAAAPRFAALFAERTLWSGDDLRPFVVDLVDPGQTLEALLLRHTRIVQPDASTPPRHAAR